MDVVFFDRNEMEDEDLKEKIQCSTVEELVHKVNNSEDKEQVAFISSANSLGFMDGGSDLGYMNVISDIEKVVKEGIAVNGELTTIGRPYLHIGDTMGFFINDKIFFICAPVMFLPQKVEGTDNQYHALKSALELCEYVGIKKVYTPMMCTGWGGHDYKSSYDLMKAAVDDHSKKPNRFFRCENNMYIYNKVTPKVRQSILDKQPKIYMNLEFGVKLI